MKLIPWSEKSGTPARIWPETGRFFDRFFEDFLNDGPSLPSLFKESFGNGMPSVDVLEKDGNLIFKVELPGMDEKDIQLQLEGNILTIKGERKLENEEDRKDYHRMESFYGSFARSFTLPNTVDLDKVKADYKNGILKITVPQRPEAKARAIPVSTS